MVILKKSVHLILFHKGDDMLFGYEIKNKKLKRMVENKADELNISVEQLISNYINRGLMSDGINEDVFWRLHSEEYLKQINDTLDVD